MKVARGLRPRFHAARRYCGFLDLGVSSSFGSKLLDLLVCLADLVDQIERFLMLLFDLFVGQFFVAELKNVLDDAWIFLELLAEWR